MQWRTRRGILALGVLSVGLGWAPTAARAQLFGGGAPMPPVGGAAMAGASQSPTSGAAMSMFGNPAMNPMMNPFLNPYLTQGTTSNGNAALYFFAAQQMGGGIGSGKLGGPNAGSTKPTAKRAATPAPGEAPRPTGANTPGAMASRYFSRTTPASTGTARYYGRQNRHYPSNGH